VSSNRPDRDKERNVKQANAAAQRIRPDMRFLLKVVASGGDSVKRCYQCATCSVVCDVSPKDLPFPRKEMLWAQWGLKDRLVGDPDLWLCHGCGDCSTHCPRGANPSETLSAVRGLVVEELSFPSVVARAVNNPKRFPVLLVVPWLLLGVSMWAAGTLKIHPGPVVWSKLMPHTVFFEGLFMALMGWGVAVGVVGMCRHWQRMRHSHQPVEGATTVPVVVALARVLKTLFLHTHFRSCGQNRARAYAHTLTFFGFLGAMMAALGGAVLENGFGISPPLPPSNAPLWAFWIGVGAKTVGILGAVGLISGPGWLLYRRLFRRKEVGATSFFDAVFLWMLFATGLSGTGVYVARLAASGVVGYPLFFVHLSLVASLLSTMAYTKFAHVFYRTTALTYALHTGRSVCDGR